MAETRWPPGPWDVSSLNMHRKSFQVSVRARCDPHPKAAEGAACLIGAAPDLYAALSDVVMRFDPDASDVECPGLSEAEVAVLRRARAALAKARGEEVRRG